MYFADLSHYSYRLQVPLPDVRNIGWLDRSMPFSENVVPSSLVDSLEKWFQIGRVNQMRGVHRCNFCRANQWPLLPFEELPSVKLADKTFLLGSSEIWIPSGDGQFFATPSLIIHYVEAHGYCPPEEFILAAVNVDAGTGWDISAEFNKRTDRRYYE